ncbi:dermonecrotic toxin domain-containing protein [Pseudomonas sp. nanlin1]|uniref:dermonecrotic toxin domain-containing protein n=1 Tax=Pseudomonas sp. nanlin1 TaxID=3040605 RepID=UPI00388D07F4
MNELDPIEQLEALEQRIEQTFDAAPSLLEILHIRLHDGFPRLPEAVRAQQLLVDGQPLTFWVQQRLATGRPLSLARPCTVSYPTERQQPPQSLRPEPLERLIELVGGSPRALFKDYLKRHWLIHRWQGQNLTARWRAALVEQLQAQLRLREQDATLPPATATMLNQLITYPDAAARQALPANNRPGVYRIRLTSPANGWEVSLPGAYVVTQRDAMGFTDRFGAFSVPSKGAPAIISPRTDCGAATLHTLACGLEPFDSLSDLYDELAERFDDERQTQQLLAPLGRADRIQALRAQALELQELHRDVFTQTIADLRAWQDRQIDDWAGNSGPISFVDMSSGLSQAIDPLGLINNKALLSTRYTALLEKNLPPWMKQASAQQKIDIMQALQALAAALALAANRGVPSLKQFAEPGQMLSYARERIKERLRADRGVEVDPDTITISVTTALQTGPIPPPTNPTSSIVGRARQQAGYPVTLTTRRYSLTELALTNVAGFDSDYALTARVSCPPGSDCSNLSPGYLQDLVRHLDIGDTYARFVKARLLHGKDAQWRQEHYRAITLARMHAEAIKARYAGHLLADRDERGYQWAAALLKQPDNTQGARSFAGHQLDIHQLLIRNATVSGVLVITSAASRSVPNLVVYTPDAPDRRAWREYRNGAQWLRNFKASPKLCEYVIARVALAHQADVRQWLSRGGAGSEVQLRKISGDFIHQQYRAEVQQVLANIDAQSTSTFEINVNQAWQLSLLLVEIASTVLPGKLLLPLALGRAFWTLWEGLDHVAQKRNSEALNSLLDSLAHSLDATSIALGSPFMARTLRKIPLKAPLLVNPSLSLEQTPPNLRFRVDGRYQEGVYEKVSTTGGPSEYFMEDRAGRTYQVLFDGEAWHVVDARNPDTLYKPMVRRTPGGDLEIISSVQWHGSTPDLPRLLEDYQRGDIAAVELDTDDRGLATHHGALYVVLGTYVVAVRKSLREDRYQVLAPAPQEGQPATILLRYDHAARHWEIKVKQAGVISAWLPVPVAASGLT